MPAKRLFITHFPFGVLLAGGAVRVLAESEELRRAAGPGGAKDPERSLAAQEILLDFHNYLAWFF